MRDMDSFDINTKMKTDIHTFTANGRSINFECLSATSAARAKNVVGKEPGTIAWIDSFKRDAIFWDIGANIGVYSLYAAVMSECRVFAFEPAAQNYYGLNRNILANKLDERITALCVAIDRRLSIANLNMRDSEIGSALHAFGDNVDYKGDSFSASSLQGSLGVSIDALCGEFGMAIPAHVKIDVDGLERAVVSGGKQTFSNPACKSVLVELDLNDAAEVNEISATMEQCGFIPEEVQGNKPRQHGEVRVYNMIFSKLDT